MTTKRNSPPDALVDEIFDQALDLSDDQRSVFLDRACSDDQQLREVVERLLELSAKPPSIFAKLPARQPASEARQPPDLSSEQTVPMAPDELPELTRLGPYRIIRELGRGGMGVVYLAERVDGHFEQQVALKVMRPGSESPHALRRFERERQIIASLNHPNIARLFDGGVAEDGRPYSAMEYVEGISIGDYCDQQRLDLEHRLELFDVVANAVHYAHRNLVVHRDLKPSNILVTTRGEIKLLDFGIAKLLDFEDATSSETLHLTGSAGLAMTPKYAAPEQLLGEPVTTAADVYQLGLLLFELLCGTPARHQTSNSLAQAFRSASEPARSLSSAFDELSKAKAEQVVDARRTTRRILERAFRGELDAIVRSALHSEPEDRYPSAAALAEDLNRYRRGFPVAVRSDALAYRGLRFLQRHRISVGFAAVIFSLLVTYSITVTLQAKEIRRERDRAQRIQAFALGLYGAADPDRALGPEVTALELVATGVDRVGSELDGEPDIQAELYAYLARVYHRLGAYGEAETLFRIVLDIRRQLHGSVHTGIATAMHDLGSILLERDDPEAFDLLEAALAQRRQLHGNDHPSTANTLILIGSYQVSRGHHDDAKLRLQEAVDIHRQHAQSPTDELAEALSGLAWASQRQGHPEVSEKLLREAYSIYRSIYGETHPEIATCLNNLASALWQQQLWDEGDTMMARSIEIQHQLYGNQHPDIATSLGNFAGSLAARKDYRQAIENYEQALVMRESVFGNRHPRVAQTSAQLAEVLRDSGELELPLELFRRSLSIFEEHLPPRHPSFARVLRGLGTLHIERGELDAANTALEEARAIYAISESSSWPPRVDLSIARIHRLRGAADEAHRMLVAIEPLLAETPEWHERWQEEMDHLTRERQEDH